MTRWAAVPSALLINVVAPKLLATFRRLSSTSMPKIAALVAVEVPAFAFGRIDPRRVMRGQAHHNAGVAHGFEEVLNLAFLAAAKAFVGAVAVVPNSERPEFDHFRQEFGVLHQGEVGQQHELHLAALGAIALEILDGLVVV